MIVYVMLQRDADDVATLLIQHGYDAQAYHAGKDSAERSRVQVPTACANRPFARKAQASRALQEEALSGACHDCRTAPPEPAPPHCRVGQCCPCPTWADGAPAGTVAPPEW